MPCACAWESSRRVSASVDTQVPQWLDSDTGDMVDVTSPDNILVTGRLESGALASAHVSAIPWHSTGYRLVVYGREGTLVLERDDYPHLGAMRLSGGSGHGRGPRRVAHTGAPYAGPRHRASGPSV